MGSQQVVLAWIFCFPVRDPGRNIFLRKGPEPLTDYASCPVVKLFSRPVTKRVLLFFFALSKSERTLLSGTHRPRIPTVRIEIVENITIREVHNK